MKYSGTRHAITSQGYFADVILDLAVNLTALQACHATQRCSTQGFGGLILNAAIVTYFLDQLCTGVMSILKGRMFQELKCHG